MGRDKECRISWKEGIRFIAEMCDTSCIDDVMNMPVLFVVLYYAGRQEFA